MNDVLVGVVAGATCSVAAAAFETVVLTERFFTIGVGGGLGSKLLIIALAGAIFGGVVGYLVGALFKQRDTIAR